MRIVKTHSIKVIQQHRTSYSLLECGWNGYFEADNFIIPAIQKDGGIDRLEKYYPNLPYKTIPNKIFNDTVDVIISASLIKVVDESN